MKATVTGNYLGPEGSPVLATRAPSPDDPNAIGGFATARGWCVRWIKACADVEVFTDGDGLKWDHGRTRHTAAPGDWIVWNNTTYRVVKPDEFASDYAAVDYEVEK